ncbi:hypothetical protein [Wolbachia endosymbiont (group A) of Rhinocyllus conicus]|uniref:hypothetical protein n=1 Tax=Wolbachia endosymbiont (group A) of Rhinocyllus conicus TaxID=2954053 RepID=UPI00222790A0|nr:hypothetical protein [Wolbachia endosymbiont (group A) of Rhinocyllus conicus]
MIIMIMKNYRSKKFTLLCNLQILLRARAIGVIQVPPSHHLSSLLFLSSQCLTLGWLCCIASYDGLKIKKMENISSLLFWYL